MSTTIQNKAESLFDEKFGRDLYSRVEKLNEEYAELTEAISDYKQHKIGSREHVLDELSDVQAVLFHISRLFKVTPDELILNAVIKVSIREHNPKYKKQL